MVEFIKAVSMQVFGTAGGLSRQAPSTVLHTAIYSSASMWHSGGLLRHTPPLILSMAGGLSRGVRAREADVSLATEKRVRTPLDTINRLRKAPHIIKGNTND